MDGTVCGGGRGLIAEDPDAAQVLLMVVIVHKVGADREPGAVRRQRDSAESVGGGLTVDVGAELDPRHVAPLKHPDVAGVGAGAVVV